MRMLRKGSLGFTLIELLIVMTIVGLLASIALPQYRYAAQRAREVVLRTNLFHMRDVIDQYFADKSKYPESLQTLVEEGYLRDIPIDPITGSRETWLLIYEESTDQTDPNAQPGVYDVRSGAEGYTLDGTPYSEL